MKIDNNDTEKQWTNHEWWQWHKPYKYNIITFVVVHGLKSYDGSLGLAERLENSIDIQAKSFFVISTDNYKTIQIHKNLDKFEK